MHIYRMGQHVSVLNDYVVVPGLGFVPVNAFVIHAAQPVVVDTGLGMPDRDFVDSLAEVIDPADVRWIWLTHPDRDHTGGLFALLDVAPQARIVTTFLSAGMMSTERPLPMGRVYLLNPGQSLDVDDRRLIIVTTVLALAAILLALGRTSRRACPVRTPRLSRAACAPGKCDTVRPDVARPCSGSRISRRARQRSGCVRTSPGRTHTRDE